MDGRVIVTNEKGEETVLYEPLPHQLRAHQSDTPNLLSLGTRGTGKSLQLRWDAIIRCLMWPNFRALVLRRKMPELRESHLAYIEYEMKMLGGVFLHTTSTAKFPNGSTIAFRHCETQGDIMDFLSSQYGAIYFDELSTFTLEQFMAICSSCRAAATAPYKAVIRAGSNPLGIGSDWMYSWFVDKDVRVEDYPDYDPNQFEMQFSTLEDNPHLDQKSYRARLSMLPEYMRRAYLLGERVVEGAYFGDFHPLKDEKPWHVITQMPTVNGRDLFDVPWLNIYRAVDWGYWPDPAVCLWITVLPNSRAIVFKERQWWKTLASDVAKQIKNASAGMRIVETYCDPTMEIKTGTTYSIGELFEQNGVPLTYGINDRKLYGYSIHNFLNTQVAEGNDAQQIMKPQIQIVKEGCPNLIRTIPQMRMDDKDPEKLADGNDHWVVALSYFCMGQAPASRPNVPRELPPWMRRKSSKIRSIALV